MHIRHVKFHYTFLGSRFQECQIHLTFFLFKGNGTVTVNKKPALVQGLDVVRITRVACGSSHSVAWATTDVSVPAMYEPVLFTSPRDPLGAAELGE